MLPRPHIMYQQRDCYHCRFHTFAKDSPLIDMPVSKNRLEDPAGATSFLCVYHKKLFLRTSTASKHRFYKLKLIEIDG
jgi:hypothetical protein